MRHSISNLTRQVLATAAISAMAITAMLAASGAHAADLPQQEVARYQGQYQEVRVAGPAYGSCGRPLEQVQLSDAEGRPTAPGRTPYYTCVTGTTLLPGAVPPPPEYCCH
ncbi:hypothetical protein SAMN05216548_11081 [Faunimonas pinastri]|uniref:Uncharacterized protein n=1 Tax=Faunimonas pinastri TaxID=1855383 RepID=A0A1H9KTP5_9HYPH|nr:hypothetical protein [Faunimonas pinastri]SER02409.1 hypothetical protein SAMN05216548_11081 [Faunimonas pinastri]